MNGIIVHVKNFHTTDCGCVEDQPQQVTVSGDASRVYTTVWSSLRLIFDTAAVRLFEPAPAK